MQLLVNNEAQEFHTLLHLILMQPYGNTVLILQTWKFRDMKWLTLGHTASKWLEPDVNPSVLENIREANKIFPYQSFHWYHTQALTPGAKKWTSEKFLLLTHSALPGMFFKVCMWHREFFRCVMGTHYWKKLEPFLCHQIQVQILGISTVGILLKGSIPLILHRGF